MSNKIDASKAPKPVGAYPHARKVGNLLFLSGIGPRDPETNEVPGLKRNAAGQYLEFDFAAQCHSVFNNVRLVLEASGAKWEDLVDVTVFLTDIERDFQTYNQLYAEYFQEVMPCRTTVGISSLPAPISIELKCIAVIGEQWFDGIFSRRDERNLQGFGLKDCIFQARTWCVYVSPRWGLIGVIVIILANGR